VPKIEQKQTVIDSIKEQMNGASSIVVVNYRGLTVEQDTELRKTLREANVTYKVFKNSMMKFAFKGTDYEQLSDVLVGPSAVAISYDDATAGPRILKAMAKTMKAIEFKAGVVEGDLFDAAGVLRVASVPSRDELIAKLLGSFKSPISSFARTMKALAEKMEETDSATAADVAAIAAAEPVEVVEETVEAAVEETTEAAVEKTTEA
jgi:large subunit ribosomal protein L10